MKKILASIVFLLINMAVFAQSNEDILGSWKLKGDENQELLHIEIYQDGEYGPYQGKVVGILGGYEANALKCPNGKVMDPETIKIFRNLIKSEAGTRFSHTKFSMIGKWYDLRNCKVEKCTVWFNPEFTELKIRNINDSSWNPENVVTLYRMTNPPNKKGTETVD